MCATTIKNKIGTYIMKVFLRQDLLCNVKIITVMTHMDRVNDHEKFFGHNCPLPKCLEVRSLYHSLYLNNFKYVLFIGTLGLHNGII